MAKLTFKTDMCKGCGLCVDVCPKKVLILAKDKINKKPDKHLKFCVGKRVFLQKY